jgi:hypothetical protein
MPLCASALRLESRRTCALRKKVSVSAGNPRAPASDDVQAFRAGKAAQPLYLA